jgi:hypothetical protein
MDGQRQKSGGRRRRRKNRTEAKQQAEPILIAARRPNAPLGPRSNGRPAVASARPTRRPEPAEPTPLPEPEPRAPTRRAARIVKPVSADADEHERLRLRLLDRVMLSEGRGAISRAATEYREHGFEFPEEQEIQLQLLEHFDESCARAALDMMTRLLETQEPIKKPILEQRLRRLEEYADEPVTRDAAAALRRAIR